MAHELAKNPSAWLRAQPSLTGAAPTSTRAEPPEDPLELFVDWLAHAAEAGVPEPHAMTLSTIDADGMPDARTLILKDVGPQGWAFAGPRSSRKGTQLARHPVAALNFWWQPLVRAVRLRGAVESASDAETAADLAARSAAARAGVTEGDWGLWRLVPSRIEFWQGSQDRRHTRIVYRAQDGGWSRDRLDGERGRQA